MFNRPQQVANNRPGTAKTVDDYVRKLPGYKPPKAEVGPDGEPIAPADTQSVREPTLPEFESDLCLITKDTTDAWR